MESRRNLLKFMALGTAAAAVGAGESKAHAARRPDPSLPASGEAPWWLLAPLGPGASVGKGWSVAGLERVERGAARLLLVKGEHRASVHLCLHEGAPKGPSHTEMFDLVLMDGGDGDKPTPVDLARVLRDLSNVIRRNEVAADGDWEQMAKLMTHSERVVAYGPENLT